jgi:hypothetical protein
VKLARWNLRISGAEKRDTERATFRAINFLQYYINYCICCIIYSFWSTTTASYPATCTNPVTCNKPNWVEDAKGNRTEMEYDPVHGGITRKIFPADAQGRRHEIRYTYEAIQPMVRNAAGQLAPGSSIWVKKAEYTCTNSAFAGPAPSMACATSTDLVTTTYEYGIPSMANNLWLRGVAVTAFVHNLGVYETRRTCYGYDDVGRLKSTISAEAGLSVCPQ